MTITKTATVFLPRRGSVTEVKREEKKRTSGVIHTRRDRGEPLPEAESIRKINYAEELYICRTSEACTVVVKRESDTGTEMPDK